MLKEQSYSLVNILNMVLAYSNHFPHYYTLNKIVFLYDFVFEGLECICQSTAVPPRAVSKMSSPIVSRPLRHYLCYFCLREEQKLYFMQRIWIN